MLDNYPVERVVHRVLTESGLAGDSWRITVVSALQPPTIGHLPSRGRARLLAEGERLFSAILHREAQVSRENAERFGVPLDWIQAPRMELDLLRFTPDQAREVWRTGWELGRSR